MDHLSICSSCFSLSSVSLFGGGGKFDIFIFMHFQYGVSNLNKTLLSAVRKTVSRRKLQKMKRLSILNLIWLLMHMYWRKKCCINLYVLFVQ